ncbi:PAS domain-containing protein [Nonomuraea sp. KM90]|uniref:PAS domain-containing protein n=1 Tax=Nonomuraea sp. KM90 TaxID=3457428 RepID=UPI003FCC3330
MGQELRCVWLNEAAQQLSDGYPYSRVGRSLTEVIDGIGTEAVQDAMRKVFAGGRPMIHREAHWSHGSQQRTMSISLFTWPLTRWPLLLLGKIVIGRSA